jgi:hypothetical protein
MGAAARLEPVLRPGMVVPTMALVCRHGLVVLDEEYPSKAESDALIHRLFDEVSARSQGLSSQEVATEVLRAALAPRAASRYGCRCGDGVLTKG